MLSGGGREQLVHVVGGAGAAGVKDVLWMSCKKLWSVKLIHNKICSAEEDLYV